MKASLDIIDCVATAGGVISMEHPADRGFAPYPSIWDTTLWKDLQRKHQINLTTFDQCRLGAPSEKPTTLALNGSSYAPLHGTRCNHGRHASLIGRNVDGKFNTKSAQAFPEGLCTTIGAALIAETLRKKLQLSLEEIPDETLEKEDPEAGMKLVVPPVGRCWDDLDRWSETFRWKWKRREHINHLEARTVLAAANTRAGERALGTSGTLS